MPDPDNKPTGPILRDPLLGTEVPMYLGGDEIVVPLPEGDRGDGLEPVAAEPSVSEPLVPETPASEPETPPDGVTQYRRADGTFMSKEEIAAAKAAETQGEAPSGEEPGAQSPEAQPQSDEARIPKARLDKEIERRKLAEKKLAELTAAEQAGKQGSEQAYDFDAAEKEYMDLLLDGKLEDAAAKRKEIRAAERAEFTALADQRAVQTTTRQSIQERMDEISSTYEKDFPGFNPDTEEYDAAALVRAQAVFKGYIESGLYDDPVEAYREALDTVVLKAGWKKAGAAAPTPPTPKPAAGAPARTAATRVAAIQNQPPLTAGAGASGAAAGASTMPDARQLTDEQLSKLPLATLKRMRGDEL